MAATLQQPQHAAPTTGTNPQLKRLVYSKYREMLGSYNDKANTIIQALPAYMVREDKGFNFNVNTNENGHHEGLANGDGVDCSVPLPPSLPANGSLPVRRLQTQAPVSEPPACVQNAMMTKDKKPFTYTPGGIDLSQIKSPRMAKRIARNAQYEGVTNQPKPSPLAQEQYNNNLNSGNSPPVAPPPPASAMGMPVQVFPTGPPPPPPPSSNSNIPPPPPPMSSTQLTPQSNGRDTRKSPTPQNFEPPPLGCRPEIKIPPNPMATLRKVPKPEPKNDFWVEEYRKERSKSPMAGELTTEEQSANQPVRQEAPPTVSSPKPTTTASTNNQENDSNPRKDPNRIAFQQQQQQQRPQPQQQQQRPQPQQYQPPQQNQPQLYQPQQTYQPQSPRPVQPTYQQQNQQQSELSYPPHMDPNRIAFQQQRQQPPQQQKREVSPVRTPVGFYQQQQQKPQPTAMSPNVQPNLQRPMSPVKQMNSPLIQQQPQSPYYARQQQQQPQYQPPQQQQQTRQYVTSPPPQQKPAQVGSLYIAPVPPENLATGSETPRSAGLQQTPPWLAPRPNLKENPDWVREVNSPPTANRTQTPPINQGQVNNGPGLRLQMNQNVTQSNAKERIIPIQIEKTPTPSRTPSTPGFGPQPYSPNNQYGSVTSPGSGYSSPSANNVRSPNQFVDQGYNTVPNQWQQQQQLQQRVVSPPAQQAGGRIVPITVERDDGPFNPNVVRGPISPAPMVIQNDPRGGPQSRSPNGMTPTPNQSKSFRVLQKITDTDLDRDSDSEQPVEFHGPQYSKQMGDTTDQMRRMQINDSNQQAFVNRADPRYRGATVPSKTFQKLKSMTDKVAATKTKTTTTAVQPTKDNQDQVQNMNWGPIQRQTQRYVQQRPIYQQEDQQQQQYIHPSEQQAPEPKIYTGSAIPSRSFKLLQAMTTPENAVETDDSRVVQNEPVYCSLRYTTPSNCQRLTSVTPPPYPLFNPNEVTISPSHSPNDFPPYQPFAYYYPQYDTDAFGDFGNDLTKNYDEDVKPIEGAPDIVITAFPDDEEEQAKNLEENKVSQESSGEYVNVREEEPIDEENGDSEENVCNEEYDFWAERERELKFSKRAATPIDLLSKRLSELSWCRNTEESSNTTKIGVSSENEDDLKLSKDFRDTVKGNGNQSDEESNNESDDLLSSSSSSEECAKNKVNSSRDGLHAIKSVTDIKVYANGDLENTEKFGDQDENNRYSSPTMKVVETPSIWVYNEDGDAPLYDAYSEEEREEGYVDYGSDTDDDGADDLDNEDVDIRDHLSVIYEEDGTESAYSPRKMRTESVNSTSSTLSECSTTIANDDQEEEGEEEEEEYAGNKTDDDKNEEEDNSVTVRLPLKLSFSRSSNDENVTTVVVGDSEIQDSRRSSLKTNEDDSGFNSKNSYHPQDEDEDHAADVSVTFSLTSRSNSMNRSGLLSKTPSVEQETSNKDWDDSDSDSVSVSVSLPMKRNKFMTQTLHNDVTNDIHEMKPEWDVNEREVDEDDRENEFRKDIEIIKECVPETIPEEEEEHKLEYKEEEIDDKSEYSEEEAKVDVKAIVGQFNLRSQTEHSRHKISRRHSSADQNMKSNLNLKNRDLKTHTSYTELPRATPDIFEALRELRIWNEKAIKRATEERELEQKFEKPKLKKDISLDSIGNCNSFLINLKQEEAKNAYHTKQEESESSEEETDESTSESSSSSERDHNLPESNYISSHLQPSSTSNKLNPLDESLSFILEETQRKCEETLRMKERENEAAKLSVRERIAAFEAVKEAAERPKTPKPLVDISGSTTTALVKDLFSRNSSMRRSESEQEEDDSGVTSDMSKPVSENDTDPECFTELRKMSRYQRAATHSRLFKLLQDGSFDEDSKEKEEEQQPKVILRPKKKIVHNVSITRRSNPDALKEAETMFQRRERLSLPLKLGNSIDADNPSSSNSPSSPALTNYVNDQLISELIQSLLLKNNSEQLKSIPWSKLQAAARKVLQEGLDVDSLENTSIESTPALTPQETKKEYQKSYADYYESWNRTASPSTVADSIGSDIIPSRTFRNLHNQSPMLGQTKFRPIRCPRVLSSKTINRDLSRLTESRESESPDRYSSPRSSATPDISREQLRATSVSRIGRV